jgi:hypothetical protein
MVVVAVGGGFFGREQVRGATGPGIWFWRGRDKPGPDNGNGKLDIDDGGATSKQRHGDGGGDDGEYSQGDRD